MNFKDYLMQEYGISESSANDYVGRFNGMVNKGIYRGENEISPNLRATIEREYPKSKNHYILTLERYFNFITKDNRG